MKTGLGVILVALLAVAAVAQTTVDTAPAHAIQGTWKKTKAVDGLLGGSMSIDMAAKTFSFAWKNRGQLTYSISDVKEDSETDMPRYTLTLKGNTGTMTVTVLAFSSSTIYIGQTPHAGIAIWGAYTRSQP